VTRSVEARKVTHLTCQGCARELRIRIDGKFPMHRVPRELAPKASRILPVCVGSQTYPVEHWR
jgi:hypothetical protein